MKTLLLLRHAKAQPDAPNGDHPRNLTDRGRRDAHTIGTVIADLIGTPDMFISSDANRAYQTAELAADSCGFTGKIKQDRAIYLAEASELVNIICAFPDDRDSIVLVGHNMGMEDLVAWLAGSDVTQHLPTAGLARFEIKVKQWRDTKPENCTLLDFTSPKHMQRQN